ncbi:MAG: hypothetical protein ABSD29_06665 [Verrucomicrobiota bacterium]
MIAYLQPIPLIAKPGLAEDNKGHSAFEKIASRLRAQTGHDFSLYKKSTVYRRIERHMSTTPSRQASPNCSRPSVQDSLKICLI